ncbi:ATP-binding protein [Paucibacter sp. R3-3]|uniref:histidine kinase n=1 Tax=Roseateles agri TaxID=3098619 RepID=A0ABU5DFV8_9BURK|nr:ATP-binding protein [Paucibacter sp. R3-3]MDY0745151.1 ATP-binding protein [Paucibacter sp. R3-3]
MPDSDLKTTGFKNMQQLIQLRWVAVLGQFVTIELAYRGLDIPLPIDLMQVVLGCLVAFNGASLLRWHGQREVSNTELLLALGVDVALLTAQLYLSGGASNPFVFLYLLQVILGAVLLEAASTWILVGLTSLCFAGLALFAEPLPLPQDLAIGFASPYVEGLFICFVLSAGLLVFMITRITRNLRQRDERLAGLRQRAAEEEHIVRMGLLASGAAHELGTPLSTLAVILGDWRRMPAFRSDPELIQEVAEMQAQVLRCKAIVSGILMSAGEARGEGSARTTVREFIDGLVHEWRGTRAVGTFRYDNRFGDDLPMAADSTVKQMICNVLDNAQEASPRWLSVEVTRQDEALVLAVTDAGPGFPPEMLAALGKPYQSSKGRPGGGLGLFLVMNVARTLGGTVTARNRADGTGAVVTITLPLASLTLEPDQDG